MFFFRLTSVPPQIGHLCHLGTLSVMNNYLRYLPYMFTFLPETLTLRGRFDLSGQAIQWVFGGFDPTCTVSGKEKVSETARSLKFWIQEEEGFYYPCSENKGTDHSCAVTAQLICALVLA